MEILDFLINVISRDLLQARRKSTSAGRYCEAFCIALKESLKTDRRGCFLGSTTTFQRSRLLTEVVIKSRYPEMLSKTTVLSSVTLIVLLRKRNDSRR